MATTQQITNNKAEANNIRREILNKNIRTRSKQPELSNCSLVLDNLWLAYQFGIGDNKVENKDFKTSEHGGENEFKYFCQKMFWDIFVWYVNAGVVANVAFGRV